MDDDMKQNMQRLSDEDLLNMVDRNPEDFTPEALEAARQEIARRGGAEQLYSKLEEELAAEEPELVEQDLQYVEEEISQHAISGRTRVLKDETVGDWSQRLILGATGKGPKVLESIMSLLEEMRMPLDCHWGITEVKTKGWVSRVRRDFLIVETDEFPDYHVYMSARDFGIFLDCIYLVTAEPGMVKRFLSQQLTKGERDKGDVEALSRPKNILKHQDFSSWKLIVRNCFNKIIDDLEKEVGQTPGHALGHDKQFLDIW